MDCDRVHFVKDCARLHPVHGTMARLPRKAVSYLRVSGLGQVAGDGFERQRQAIAVAARRMRLQVVAEFAEEGVSGTLGLAARPALARLLGAVLEDEAICVMLVEKADRLARDLVEGELLLRELRRAGVRVVEAESGQDLTAGDDANPTAKLIRQILGAVSEFEKSALVAKLRAARDRARASRGRCEGPKPYGCREGEAEAVQLIRELRGSGMSLRAIAAELDRRGVPSRSGRPWQPTTVARVLARD